MLEQDYDMPTAVVYGFVNGKDIPSVVFDDESAADAVVTRLLESGTEQIGVIAGEKNSIHTVERLLGCQRALFRKNILYNPELVVYGDWSRECGYEGAGQLLSQGIHTIFSMNDDMAVGIYDYADDHGLIIGQDLLVAGIGNKYGDVLRPKLTTVEMPLFEMGRYAGNLILDLLEKRKDCKNDTYKIAGQLRNAQNGRAGKV